MQGWSYDKIDGKIWTSEGQNTRCVDAPSASSIACCRCKAVRRRCHGDRMSLERFRKDGRSVQREGKEGAPKASVMGALVVFCSESYPFTNGVLWTYNHPKLRWTTPWKSARTTAASNGFALSCYKRALTWQESWCPELDIHMLRSVTGMNLNKHWSVECTANDAGFNLLLLPYFFLH